MECIDYTVHQQIGIITFSRPESLNAINHKMLSELNGLLDEIENSKTIRVLVLTGEGKAFIAGADIAEMHKMHSAEAEEFSRFGQKTLNRLEQLPFPVIGAINGFALGGGLEVALACDFLLASEKAKFSAPELNLGLIPGFAGTQRLTQAIGANNARFYLFTANMFDATQALKMGLVQLVVEPKQLMEEAMKMAHIIGEKGQNASQKLKTVVQEGLDNGWMAGMTLESNVFGSLFETEAKEGMQAFLEKRKPKW